MNNKIVEIVAIVEGQTEQILVMVENCSDNAVYTENFLIFK